MTRNTTKHLYHLSHLWISLDVELIAVSPVKYAFRFHSQNFHFPASVCIIITKRDTQEIPLFLTQFF